MGHISRICLAVFRSYQLMLQHVQAQAKIHPTCHYFKLKLRFMEESHVPAAR